MSIAHREGPVNIKPSYIKYVQSAIWNREKLAAIFTNNIIKYIFEWKSSYFHSNCTECWPQTHTWANCGIVYLGIFAPLGLSGSIEPWTITMENPVSNAYDMLVRWMYITPIRY